MFDISFSELALCFIVALIVLGPERLPKVARTVGRWSGQARAYMRNLTSELERETNIADLKKQFQEAQQALLDSKQALEASTRQLGNDVQENLRPASDVLPPKTPGSLSTSAETSAAGGAISGPPATTAADASAGAAISGSEGAPKP